MTTFETPQPIHVDFALGAGNARLRASDRTDTVVEVLPTNPSKEADVQAAQATRVDFSDNLLVVKMPRNLTMGFFGRSPSIDIRIDLPQGSEVRGDAASADITVEGVLGDSSFNVASGDVRVAEAEAVAVKSASGDVSINTVSGQANIASASGDIRVQHIGGSASMKTASGSISLGQVTGDLNLATASGDATIDRAHGSVKARSASGDVTIREAASGTVQFDAASGDVLLGVSEGTAAWLDVKSLSGRINQSLGATEDPENSANTLEFRARTISGNITVQRA